MENGPNSASTLYPWFVSCGIETASGYYTQPGVGSKLSEEEILSTHWASGRGGTTPPLTVHNGTALVIIITNGATGAERI
jgi:hypothetical protein